MAGDIPGAHILSYPAGAPLRRPVLSSYGDAASIPLSTHTHSLTHPWPITILSWVDK